MIAADKTQPTASAVRVEQDSLGQVNVPTDRLWGAQTQRSLEHFSIGDDLIPLEMIPAYANVKKAAALVNHQASRLGDMQKDLIVRVCDEILTGQHHDQFPLHVWMTGSGTLFNMNVNEVIANRCSQIAGEPLGSHTPVHPNDHVNMSQSSNDSFPTAMNVAAAIGTKQRLLPAVRALRDALDAKAHSWADIVKIGRTHLQDATPLTLGQEFSGYVGMLEDDLERSELALRGVYRLALGGTAVGTGLNSLPGFDKNVAAQIAELTGLSFVTAPNKFTVQGAHDDLVQLSATLTTLAVSLFKIANDIRLLSCGPRDGFAELKIPANERRSSIMPGKVNPTQCEALAMIAAQVMANDFAVAVGGASGYLEMNVYKPLLIFNITKSVRIMTDGCTNFRKFPVEGTEANLRPINNFVELSLMLVTALSPVIGHDSASKVAHCALEVCYYNDDIQGTGAVTLAGLIAALKVSGSKIRDQRILFLGAGSAAIGLAGLIASAMVQDGLSLNEAQARISMFDVNGLLEQSRMDLFDFQKPYAHPNAPTRDFVAAIVTIKPTMLIGVSTVGRAFTRQVIEAMSRLNDQPIIFALSNPTEHAECTPEEAYRWSKGKALYATGVPFPPVSYGGQTFLPGQANNFFIFPAVGMAIYATQPKRVTDEMFIEAAHALADQVTPDQLKQGLLFPLQLDILETEIKVAARVAKVVFDSNLAAVARPADYEAFIRGHVYKPEYCSFS